MPEPGIGTRGQQLTLDGRDTRFRLVEIEKGRWMEECWAAKCSACGAWLTKWDYSESDAAECATDALDRTDGLAHRCKP
jgi:hypothetical protein